MEQLKRTRLNIAIALLSSVCILGTGATILFANAQKSEPQARENITTAAYTVGASSTAEFVQADEYCGAGLQTWLKSGDSLTVNTVIDLNDFEASEPLFEGYTTPTKSGVADYRRLFFTLADAEDPSVSISIQYRGWGDENYSVVSACASGQAYTSVEWYNGKLWAGKHSWHTISMHTFTGLIHENNGNHVDAPVEAPVRVWYDSDTNMLYYDVNEPKTHKQMIIDLDSPDYFETLFNGFPSGRIRLTVQADDYLKERAGFRLTKAGNIDLAQEKISDNIAPDITVDTPWTENVPTAKVGGSFPVPNAEAYDAQFGVCEVATKVEYSATQEGERTDVAVSDGRFVTEHDGYYFIAYTARDPLGNTASETITVRTGEVVAPAITVDSGDDAANTGTLVSVRTAAVSPESETTRLSIKAVLGEEEIVVENGAFRPMRGGDWTVNYAATDICGQTETKSYTLKVTASDAPVFITEPNLPETFISGGRYFLPKTDAVLFDGDTEQNVPTTVKVKDAAGERIVATDEVYIPRVSQNRDKVKITYEADGSKWEREVECILPFVAENGRMRLKIENYFTLSNVELEKYDYNTKVSAQSSDGGVVFNRELLLETFSVGMASVPDHSEFDALYITLKDTGNRDRTVTCKLQRKEGGNTEFVSGNIHIAIPAMFVPYTASTSISISFQNGAWMVNGNWSLAPRYWDNGSLFDGFVSEYVYLETGFENAKTGASFMLASISGQPISANPYDSAVPYISLKGDFGGSVQIGSVVNIHEAFAVDVLDPMANVNVSVRKPNGEVATSVDGVKLDRAVCSRAYQFKVEEYGDYLVTYTASDSFGGNTRDFNYVVGVFDEEAPEITVKGTPVAEGKVGEAFLLPSVEVVDNETAAENIRISTCVFTPKGVMVYMGANSNAFVPVYAGEYTVIVTAYDEAGNVATYTHKVTVK